MRRSKTKNSRKSFRNSANKTHRANITGRVKRGGGRL